MKHNSDVLIIGGGMAGLSAASKLANSKRSFRLITEDIGGRMHPSADGRINYGA